MPCGRQAGLGSRGAAGGLGPAGLSGSGTPAPPGGRGGRSCPQRGAVLCGGCGPAGSYSLGGAVVPSFPREGGVVSFVQLG